MATSPDKTKTKTKPQPAAQRTWIKNHPLEGDGLVTGFYNFLHKRNPKTMKACKDVLIPDTIVFDHNFPRGWYTSDLKSKEIMKKQGKELDASSIFQAFSKTQEESVCVVASYMSSFEDEQGATVTQVEFFNKNTLEEFVGRKTKREGVLQKFVVPKGLRNSVIQVVWSPKICLIQRRTNMGSIKDKLQCMTDPYPVSVTYEGPTHFSEEGSCAAHTKEEVKTICRNIFDHFIVTEHKTITRMVLYFKVDEKDQAWLLWCGSLRVADRGQPSQMPLNLAPKFSTAQAEGTGDSYEDELLLEADSAHHAMTGDTLFYTTYIKPNSPNKHDGDDDENGDNANPGSTTKSQSRRQNDDKNRNNNDPNDDDEDSEEWHKQPGIQDQYRQLCINRELVLSAFDDIFYEAYGHFLRHDPGPFNFTVDQVVAETLGMDVLQELMQAKKIDHALPSDEGHTTVEDEEVSFTIPPMQHGPVTKLGDAVAKWINEYYDRRVEDLKEEAASPPPPNDDAPPSDNNNNNTTEQTKEETKKDDEQPPPANEENEQPPAEQ